MKPACFVFLQTVQQLVRLLWTRPFQLLLKLTAILPVVWLDSGLRLALILAHKFPNLRRYLFSAMTHARYFYRFRNSAPAMFGAFPISFRRPSNISIERATA